MNGPDHYQMAEEFLRVASTAELGSDEERYHLNAAQVHATLAHTAAVADAGSITDGAALVSDVEARMRAWRKAMS
jgi:hypothetical protein